MAEHFNMVNAIFVAEGMHWEQQSQYKHHLRYDQALWYAWGWLDAFNGQAPQDHDASWLTLDDGWTFGLVVGITSTRYDNGELYSMPSMIDAWRQYRDIVVPRRKQAFHNAA